MFEKMKIVAAAAFLFLAFSGLLSADPNTSIYNPPTNLFNIRLLASDIDPEAKFVSQARTVQILTADGWEKSSTSSLEDVVPGLSDTVAIGPFKAQIKYGFFSSSSDAKFGAISEVKKNPSGLMTGLFRPGGFTTPDIGDESFRWEMAYEVRPNIAIQTEDFARLSFSLGQYAVAIDGGWENSTLGTMGKGIFDLIALKCEKKIRIVTALDGFSFEMSRLIQNQGILRSLQAKIDSFTKNYLAGQYGTVLNNIISFVHELEAQRGKHVSEEAYQTLKSFADTIIANTNSLL